MRTKKLPVVIMIPLLVLTLFLMLILPDRLNDTVVASVAFIVVGYVLQLLLCLRLSNTPHDAETLFINAPFTVVSGGYLLFVSVFSILCAVFSNAISVKAAIIAHVALLIVALIIQALLLGVRKHIHRVDARQKDHHISL